MNHVLSLFLAAAFAVIGPTAYAQTLDQNSAVRARIDQLKQALAGDVCADPHKAQKLLAGQDASLPPIPTPLKETAALGPLPSTPSSGETANVLPRAQLVEVLHKAVVLVIAESDTGSGFFISPDIALTNEHVVKTAINGEVQVVGGGTGGVRRARVIDRLVNAEGRDYAILKVEGVQVEHFLPLTDTARELTNVVAAGYPGLLLDNDQNFRALLRGDLKALPDLAFSQGAVMAIQNRGRGLMMIAHSAPISGGNSGGPLVDTCGRVLGINTFINVSVTQASSAGFALASQDMLSYLNGKGVPYARHDAACRE